MLRFCWLCCALIASSAVTAAEGVSTVLIEKPSIASQDDTTGDAIRDRGYVDGDRERIPYEADAYLNQLSHYTTDDDVKMAARTFNWLIENGTWPTEWAPHMVFMAYAEWMYSGDNDWLKHRYESLKPKTLLHRTGEDGLVRSDELDQKRHDDPLGSLGSEVQAQPRLEPRVGSRSDKPVPAIFAWGPAIRARLDKRDDPAGPRKPDQRSRSHSDAARTDRNRLDNGRDIHADALIARGHARVGGLAHNGWHDRGVC